jgi:hypothetical protein
MANEPSILARPQPRTAPAGSDDYRAFSEVLGASARGRAFLDEHARRSHQADTAQLLAALSRIEATMRANAGATAEPLRAELRKLIALIRRARPELAVSSLPARAAKLAVLLDLLERRLADLVAPAPLPAAAGGAEPNRAHLAVVPPAEEPELPIPSPAQPPTLTMTAKAIPEVTWFPGSAGAAPQRALTPAAAGAIATSVEAQAPPPVPPAEEALWDLSVAKLAPPPPDPLAAIMLLSEDERIALFT